MRLIWHKLQQTQESLTENTNQTAVDVTTTCKGKLQRQLPEPQLSAAVRSLWRCEQKRARTAATLRTQNQLSKWEPRKLPDIYICTYCTVHNSTRHRNGTLQATPRNSCTVMLFSQQPVARLEESLTQRHKAQAPCNMTHIHTHTCIA